MNTSLNQFRNYLKMLSALTPTLSQREKGLGPFPLEGEG